MITVINSIDGGKSIIIWHMIVGRDGLAGMIGRYSIPYPKLISPNISIILFCF